MKPLTLLSLSIATALFFISGSGCKGKHVTRAAGSGDTLTTCSRLLTMVDFGDYIEATVKNPWDTASTLATYALVPKGAVLPELSDGVTVIATPVENALVYSSVHAGVMKELNVIDKVKGVADVSYYKISEIVDGIKAGTVTDVGQSMSPNVERIASLSPDVMLVSHFENAGHGVIDKLGVPLVECADYMEATPLARAEWIKLIGALTGKLREADSIFTRTVTLYNNLASQVKASHHRPRVLVEQVSDGVWYLPGGKSYQAQLLVDAGALYPWSDDTSAGSLQLSAEAVLDKARDADYWLIKSYGYELTRDMLAANNSFNSRFKAFEKGNIYFSDTKTSTLYEEFPFHPELLLKEYIHIFHPSLLKDDGMLRYYKRIQ